MFKIGWHPSFPWTDELDTKLRNLWLTNTYNQLALQLNCSKYTVERRAIRLGLTKPQKTWPKQLEQRFIALWDEGLPAREIAAQLGVSRNAILGKRNRLNLPMRVRRGPRKATDSDTATKAATTRKRQRKPTGLPRPPRWVPIVVTPINQLAADMRKADDANPGITLFGLKPGLCKDVLRTFPDGARYCGNATLGDNRSFCPGHHAIYYVPYSNRRPSRRP